MSTTPRAVRCACVAAEYFAAIGPVSVTSLPLAPFTFTPPAGIAAEDPAGRDAETDADDGAVADDAAVDEPAAPPAEASAAEVTADVAAAPSPESPFPHPATTRDAAVRPATTPMIRRAAIFLMGPSGGAPSRPSGRSDTARSPT